MSRWAKPAVLIGLGLLVYLNAQSRLDAADSELSQRIGELQPTATLVRDIPRGTPLNAAQVAYPLVPVRWRQPAAYRSPTELDGQVAAADLKAGTTLGPGTAQPELSLVTAPLRAGERLASTVAVAPAGSLKPGMLVEVVVTSQGMRPTVIAKRAVLVRTRPVKSESGLGEPDRVQAELRTSDRAALKLASAASSGSEVRLIPIPGGG